MTDRAPVAVVGGGSWGTALALHVARLGRPSRLWVRDPARAQEMACAGENARYLPGVTLPGVDITSSAERALAGADIVVVAVPSHAIEGVIAPMAPSIGADAVVLSAA